MMRERELQTQQKDKNSRQTIKGRKEVAYLSAVGYRSNDSGSLNNVGDNGYCWSASPNPSNAHIIVRSSFGMRLLVQQRIHTKSKRSRRVCDISAL